jgi:hypothetical protein
MAMDIDRFAISENQNIFAARAGLSFVRQALDLPVG